MKKLTTLFVFFLFCVNAYSQRTVLSFDKMNILYIGIDNPIELAGNNIDCKSVKFETYNMSLKCDDTCKCIAITKSQGKSAVVVFKDNHVLDTIVFQSKMIPELHPYAVINDLAGGRYPAIWLPSWKKLELKFDNFDFDAKYEVLGFDIYHESLDSTSFCIHNEGCNFGKEWQLNFNKIKKGDLIYIDNIRALMPDNSFRILPEIAFKVD